MHKFFSFNANFINIFLYESQHLVLDKVCKTVLMFIETLKLKAVEFQFIFFQSLIKNDKIIIIITANFRK